MIKHKVKLPDHVLEQLTNRKESGETLESIAWGFDLPVGYIGKLIADYQMNRHTKQDLIKTQTTKEEFDFPDITIGEVIVRGKNMYRIKSNDIILFSGSANKFISIPNSHE